MKNKVLVRVLIALLIGVVGVVGTLLLLSQGASARPMAQGVEFTKSTSNETPRVGEVFTFTLTFWNTSTEQLHVRVTDPNPAPSHLEIITPTITGGATYSSTIGGTGPEGIVWEGLLGVGSLPQVVSYQMEVTGVLTTAMPVTNTAYMIDLATPGSLPEATAEVGITIMPAMLHHIVIEDAAGGTGSEVVTHSMAAGEVWQVWAAGYDEHSDYIGDVTVTWSGTGVVTGRLTPTNGISSAFTAETAGTGTIGADDGSSHTDDTGTITVTAGVLDHIVLSPVTATILAGQIQTYTVEAFDVYSNTRGDVTGQTDFSIVEPGHGGYWTDNVYTSHTHGDWTVWSVYTGTIVTTDTASLTVLVPILHLDKEDGSDPVEAGDYLTYTLTYSNTGNQTASGVVITDVLDANVSYVNASPTPAGGLPDAPFWSISPLAPDAVSQICVTVTVTSPLTNGTILTNTAWLDADQTTAISATQSTTVHSRPVLTITKTDYPDPVDAGGVVRYTLIITNSGNENASPVTITEQYDPNVSFFDADPNPTSGENVWVFPTLSAGDSESINIFVTVASPLPVGTVLTNQVTLDSGQTTPISATEITSVTTASELTVSKIEFSGDPVQAGADLVYLISYQNGGTAPAEDVVITETYDSRVTFVEATRTPITGTNNAWEIGDLNVGDGGNFAVTVRVDTPLANGTILTNLVTIDSRYTSPKTYTETTGVSSAPDLAFSVTDYPDPVEAGGSLAYTLHYANSGNADATQAVVTATLDNHVSFSSATPSPDGGSGQVRYWNVGTIAGEGGSGQIVINTNVTLPLTNGTTLDFAAQIGDAEGDLEEATAQTQVHSAPVLSFHKSDGVSTVYAGDRLTYTLTYTNSGNENAYSVTITDTLSSYVTYVDCEIAGGSCQHTLAGEVVFQIPVIVAKTNSQSQLVVSVNDPLPAGADFVINHAKMTASSLPASIDVQDVDHIGTLPDLVVAVTHEPSLFSPGKLMTYTVSYGNAGRIGAGNVSLTTTLPPGTTYAGGGWTSSDGQTYAYSAGGIPSGANRQVYFVVHYPDQPQIDAVEFNTPFTIGTTEAKDANPGDNATHVYIGVPDLIITDFVVDPLPLEPGQPVTFTVTVKNQGTGIAWNPDNGGGFWVDVFIAPVASYPFERYSEKQIFAGVPSLAPGLQHTLVIIHGGFSEQEILEEIKVFYVKADNYAEPIRNGNGEIIGWTRLYGVVPEHDETNNLGGPIDPRIGPDGRYIFLPLISK